MRYSLGQKVIINKDSGLDGCMKTAASKLDPPYVATISNIVPDPHSGSDMYLFEECNWGWYDHEVESLYIEDKRIESRFDILDIR